MGEILGLLIPCRATSRLLKPLVRSLPVVFLSGLAETGPRILSLEELKELWDGFLEASEEDDELEIESTCAMV
jgi:hypothetical protein